MHLNAWDRYVEFLERLLPRYDAASVALVTASKGLFAEKSPPEGQANISMADLARLRQLDRELHLEVESFYVFAKVLLDRIADTILATFDEPPVRYGSSHQKLVQKRLAKIAGKVGEVDVALRSSLEDLQRRVVALRTERIEHLADPRHLRMTSYSPAGRAKLSFGGMVYPTRDELEHIGAFVTEDLFDLMERLDSYIGEVTTFLRMTIEKSVWLVADPEEGAGGEHRAARSGDL